MYEEIPEKKIKVVLVEDDLLYRTCLKKILADKPSFQVVGEAEDGQTAVKIVNEVRPDVVLMDLGIPVIDGIQATRKIKEANPNVKVIELTSHSDEDEAMLSLGAGANGYVRKNIETDYLVMIINTIERGAVWIDPLIGKKVISKFI